MSTLLDEIIQQRKEKALEYQAHLKEIAALVKQIAAGQADDTPKGVDTPAKRALYHNLNKNESLALQIDTAVSVNKQDGWRGNQAKQNLMKKAILKIVKKMDEVERLFAIVIEQRGY